MPTDISNAVGTARQFTPQPDRTYQGRYEGVGVANGAAPAITDFTTLANNLVRLDSAFQNYRVGHERYLMETGIAKSQQMINSMTPEDIEKLNVLDAAQQFGMVDVKDNPYFSANADKIRGEFLSTKMRQEYDDKYAFDPAKSADEEQARFADFASEWKNNLIHDNTAPENMYAFDMGYNGTNLMSANQLAEKFYKKKYEDNVKVTLSSTKSKLGAVITNSVQLLENDGLMTENVQSIMNETRLMGLPVSYREKLWNDFAMELIQTGHLDADRLEQMSNSVVLASDDNGEPLYASDFMDMQTYKTAALHFNMQFLTQKRQDRIKQYGDKKNLKGYTAKIEELRKTNPEEAIEWEADLPAVRQLQENKIREENAVKQAKLKASLDSQKAAFKDKQAETTINGALDVWIQGGDMYNGMPISSYTFDDSLLYSKVMNNLQYYMLGDNGNAKFQYISRLMSLPQVSKMRNSIVANLTNTLDNVVPSKDGGVVTSETSRQLLNFFQANSNSCEHIYGAEVGKRAKMLKNLVDVNGGDFDAGLQMFATFNAADSDAKAGYKQQATDVIARTGYTAECVPHLGGGTDTVRIWGNPNMEQAVEDTVTALMCQGYSAESALNKAGAIIQRDFVTYHWGQFPKGCMSDLGTSSDEGYFKDALDFVMYDVSDGFASNTTMEYDRTAQMFYFVDTNTNKSTSISLAEIRRRAKADYDRDLAWYQKNH